MNYLISSAIKRRSDDFQPSSDSLEYSSSCASILQQSMSGTDKNENNIEN